MTRFSSIEEVRGATGRHLGHSRWRLVDQEAIDSFADVTGDHQWIHVDPERARTGPFGSTIAHGYLTLSLASVFIGEIVEFGGIGFAVNYGLNRVRFPAPVPVDSRVRAGAEVAGVEDVGGGGVQVALALTFEREGGEKPVCVAEALVRLYP